MSNSDITVKFRLRGGHKVSANLAKDSAELNLVKRWRRGEIAEGFVLQIPSSKDRGNTAFSIGDIVEASFTGEGEHPAMNVSEGHLGGYISARHPRSEELGVQNGDPATYTPDLWRWLVEELGVASVLDIGCGRATPQLFSLVGLFRCWYRWRLWRFEILLKTTTFDTISTTGLLFLTQPMTWFGAANL